MRHHGLRGICRGEHPLNPADHVAAGTRATVEEMEGGFDQPLFAPPTWRDWSLIAAVWLGGWALLGAGVWALLRR